MDSPVTLRLDKETRERIGRIAERKRVSASEVIREAIEAFVKEHDVAAPYERAAERDGLRRIFTVDKKDFSTYRLHGRTSFSILP